MKPHTKVSGHGPPKKNGASKVRRLRRRRGSQPGPRVDGPDLDPDPDPDDNEISMPALCGIVESTR